MREHTSETAGKARPFRQAEDLRPLVEELVNARIVILGGVSAGSRESQRWRRVLTEWLLLQGGFDFVAVEADWSACRPARSYALGLPGSGSADGRRAIDSLRGWPDWRWANSEMVHLVEWLRRHNMRAAAADQVGFFGLDVFCASEAARAWLERRPPAERPAVQSYLAEFSAGALGAGGAPEGLRLAARAPVDCAADVERMSEMLAERLETGALSGNWQERDFDREVTRDADLRATSRKFYGELAALAPEAWGTHNQQLLGTLEILLARYGRKSKAIVWTDDARAGDRRATVRVPGLPHAPSLGELARRRFGVAAVALVGFAAYAGAVTAAARWGDAPRARPLEPACPGSLELALHEAAAGASRYLLNFSHGGGSRSALEPWATPLLHRLLGPVQGERYEPVWLARRYDACIFFDRTRPLEPLPALPGLGAVAPAPLTRSAPAQSPSLENHSSA